MSLTQAITRLFDASSLTDNEWATFHGYTAIMIRRWRNGFTLPNDEVMSKMLEELERIKGSTHCPELPDALDAFWSTVEECERSGVNSIQGLGQWEFETVSQCLTRFTCGDRMGSLMRNIHLIPPRRRRDFFDAMVVLFNEYVPKGS